MSGKCCGSFCGEGEILTLDKGTQWCTLIILSYSAFLRMNATIEPTTIGVKEFRQKLPKVLKAVERGHRFTIVRYSKPVAQFTPVHTRAEKRYTIEDLLAIRFKTKDKNLSKKVDEIVYGV